MKYAETGDQMCISVGSDEKAFDFIQRVNKVMSGAYSLITCLNNRKMSSKLTVADRLREVPNLLVLVHATKNHQHLDCNLSFISLVTGKDLLQKSKVLKELSMQPRVKNELTFTRIPDMVVINEHEQLRYQLDNLTEADLFMKHMMWTIKKHKNIQQYGMSNDDFLELFHLFKQQHKELLGKMMNVGKVRDAKVTLDPENNFFDEQLYNLGLN